jgi:hypothetical protein
MSSFFKELGEFLWAVITNWAGYTTGGLIVALLWLWSTLRQVPISRKVGMAVSVGFLFIAFFTAWQEQHQLLADANAKLDALTQPQLNGDGLVLASSSIGRNGEDTLVLVSGVITNKGAPTMLQNWRVEMELPDGHRRLGQSVDIQRDMLAFQGSNPNISTAQLPASAWWPRLSVMQSVPTMGSLPGWLLVKFKGITVEEIVAQKVKFFLFYHDVNGKEWVTEEDTIHGPPPNPNISQQQLEIEMRQSHPELQNIQPQTKAK